MQTRAFEPQTRYTVRDLHIQLPLTIIPVSTSMQIIKLSARASSSWRPVRYLTENLRTPVTLIGKTSTIVPKTNFNIIVL